MGMTTGMALDCMTKFLFPDNKALQLVSYGIGTIGGTVLMLPASKVLSEAIVGWISTPTDEEVEEIKKLLKKYSKDETK